MEELTFGRFIKEKRMALGFSLTEMGAKLGCSAPYLSGMENGKENPADDMVKKISKHLKLNHDDLSRRVEAFRKQNIKGLKAIPSEQVDGVVAFYKTCIQKGISTKDAAEILKERI
jgi:transcriptional regulator with XRE-family HTH domain